MKLIDLDQTYYDREGIPHSLVMINVAFDLYYLGNNNTREVHSVKHEDLCSQYETKSPIKKEFEQALRDEESRPFEFVVGERCEVKEEGVVKVTSVSHFTGTLTYLNSDGRTIASSFGWFRNHATKTEPSITPDIRVGDLFKLKNGHSAEVVNRDSNYLTIEINGYDSYYNLDGRFCTGEDNLCDLDLTTLVRADAPFAVQTVKIGDSLLTKTKAAMAQELIKRNGILNTKEKWDVWDRMMGEPEEELQPDVSNSTKQLKDNYTAMLTGSLRKIGWDND